MSALPGQVRVNFLSHQRLVPIVIVLLVIVFKLPTLQTPYYWDEAGAYFAPSLWLSCRDLLDLLPGRHPAGMFFGHPPLLYFLMAVLFKLFGHSPVVAHLPIVLFAAAGALYTFKLGEFLFDRKVGVGGAALLVAAPLYFAQAGMFLGDIPAAACGVATVYYYVRKSHYRYLLFGTAAVLIKEHAALLILVLMLFDCPRLSMQIVTIRTRLWHSLPLLMLGIFFIMQKLMAGSFLPNPYFASNPFLAISPAAFAFKLAFVNYWAYFAQGRFMLAIVTLLAAWRFRRSLPGSFPLLAAIIGSYLAAYSVIYCLPRYILVILPFICLLGSASLAFLVKGELRYAAALTALMLTGFFAPDLKGSAQNNFETSMQYKDVVSIHRQAAAYLERNASGELIYAPWPLSVVWTKADYGYLKMPLKMTADPHSSWKYVALPQQADRAQVEAIEALIGKSSVDKVAHFESNGKVIDLFSRRDSAQGIVP